MDLRRNRVSTLASTKQRFSSCIAGRTVYVPGIASAACARAGAQVSSAFCVLPRRTAAPYSPRLRPGKVRSIPGRWAQYLYPRGSGMHTYRARLT